MTRKNPFIGKFVNEMYAILLGIGISNIIFVQQINLKDIFDVIQALFVTSVALIYWWDWTEYIESNIQTSKREFLIDFLILINIEMLFAYFNEPEKLIVVFIVLGILDLIWVLNYIYELKLENKYSKHASATWIGEKIIVIISYVISYLLIVHSTINIFENEYVQSLLIIASFVIARNIGFNQVQKITKYQFEKASYQDLDAIVDINNSYIENYSSEKGFLLKRLTYYSVIQNMSNGHSEYFVVKTITGKVVGFVEISNNYGEIEGNIEWENEEIKELLLFQGYKYIEQIAISQEYARSGLGTFIYENLYRQFPNKNLTAFVMTKPKFNRASIHFHEKQQFEKVATFRKETFHDFSNFESYLFVRKSSK